MKKTLALLFFLIVVIAVFYAILTQNVTVEFIAKPLITVSLAVLYLVSVSKPDFWYVSALFFSFWGDSLLMFKDQYFVFGLGSFLLAHILYISLVSKYLDKVSISKILTHSIPFVGFLVFLIWLIYPSLNKLLIPVIIYGIAISVFGVVSFLIYTQNKSTENLWLFLGALIFISSDSVLAINKFCESKEVYGIIIMATYILAQFLICNSVIAKSK